MPHPGADLNVGLRRTAMSRAADPRFEYLPDETRSGGASGGYELRIQCTSGGIDFDRFIYWPSERYPERFESSTVERIGRWAYEHE